MDSFDIILLSKQISAMKRSFYVRTCPVRKRKALGSWRLIGDQKGYILLIERLVGKVW